VKGGVLDRAHLETVSGSVRFEGGLAKRATLDAESVSGTIDLTLPSGIAADFSLSTFSGHIDTQWGTVPSKEKYSPEKRLEYSTGANGATITVHTLSGGIRVTSPQ
jgi:DUF4097 and DUF4098 domain-containing protein YvlB